MGEDAGLSYCAAELRRDDPDRYATLLFAPAARREALFALYAFNLEVAKTAEVVSEPMLGYIRLQWWRDALAEIYQGRPRRHAVVQPLAQAVRDHGLPREILEAIVDAREVDLEPAPPPTLEALEDYAEATSARLLTLAVGLLLDAAGDRERAAAETAARSIGMAWTLLGLVRAVPFHAARKRLLLPADRVAAAGLDTAGLFEPRSSPALCQVSRELLGRARLHLRDARRQRRRVPRSAHPPLLLAGLADRHIARLERAAYDPFAPAVAGPLQGVLWRLALSVLRRRF